MSCATCTFPQGPSIARETLCDRWDLTLIGSLIDLLARKNRTTRMVNYGDRSKIAVTFSAISNIVGCALRSMRAWESRFVSNNSHMSASVLTQDIWCCDSSSPNCETPSFFLQLSFPNESSCLAVLFLFRESRIGPWPRKVDQQEGESR